jgi:hypothetical protein
MTYIKVEPMVHPRENGESWWIVHPNTRGSEFKIPSGAVTACTTDFLGFKAGTVYPVLEIPAEKGWVGVKREQAIYLMPEYVFARYFDAEAFVVGPAVTPTEIERAIPYNYRPTLPRDPSKQREPEQLELFEDDQWSITCGEI